MAEKKVRDEKKLPMTAWGKMVNIVAFLIARSKHTASTAADAAITFYHSKIA